MPQQNGAIGRARRDVAVGGDVALGPRQTRNDIEVAEDNLHYFCRFSQIDAETVVPETARNQKSTVDRGHETIGTYFQFLTEIVAQMASNGRRIIVGVRLH